MTEERKKRLMSRLKKAAKKAAKEALGNYYFIGFSSSKFTDTLEYGLPVNSGAIEGEFEIINEEPLLLEDDPITDIIGFTATPCRIDIEELKRIFDRDTLTLSAMKNSSILPLTLPES